MKKNKKVKENFDNVVIKNVELTPTTIGKIDSNEGGLKAVLMLFASLLIIIFVLPYVVNIINSYNESQNPPPVIVPEEPTSSENQPSSNVTDNKQAEFISVDSPISKTINGYLYEITVDLNLKTVKANITNTNGSSYLLVNTPMFIELYNSEKTLLDRILITKREIVKDSTIAFTYIYKDNTNNNQTPAFLTLDTKNINDYPAISLESTDINNTPFLTCTKDNTTLVYNFTEDDNNYKLKSISERILVSDSNDNTVNTYEALVTSYNSIDGVNAELIPNSNGFQFEANLDLTKIIINDKKRVLNNYAFYEKDTFAKTIAFELNSSGYKCQ